MSKAETADVAVDIVPDDAAVPVETPETAVPVEAPKKGLFAAFGRRKGGEPKKKEPAVPLLQLFRFADTKDRIMLVIGFIFSVGIGALIPGAILVLGSLLGNGSLFAGAGGSSPSSMQRPVGAAPPTLDPTSVYPQILAFVYIGIAMLISGYASQALWVLAGENQARRIRELYMRSILRQDMSWFDLAEEGSLTTRLAQDTGLIQDGISEKAGLCVQCIAQFLTGFVIAFAKGPTLALVLLAAVPVMATVGVVMFSLLTKLTAQGQDAYAEAGAVAEQVISGIRTIYSFSLQARFAEKYDVKLEKAEAADRKGGITRGVGFGSFMLVMFSTYGLAFWYGSRLVLQGKMAGQDVLVTFLSLMMGSFALMMIPQNLAAVGAARGAAYKIFSTIDRVPAIDSLSKEGKKLESLQGQITFKNVKFSYPTRPDTQIFDDFSISVEPGQTVAFVGPSGSGKSTTVQLIQRFYDPHSGTVSVDGVNLTEMNVKWFRQQIGIVSQEPVLFNTSIKQNILMGAVEDESKPITEAELHEVCRVANCHNFIMDLPEGYDTFVGEHGGMLSGGQKQRIAIARALIKNPKILLLDEATSALDTHSERLVQNALDKASKDRTTIVIAHRLSTIKNADKIIVLDKGTIIESGTHNELLALNGVYSQLVEKQKIRAKVDDVLSSKSMEEDEVEGDLVEVAPAFVKVVEKDVVKQSKTAAGADTRLTLQEESAQDRARREQVAHEEKMKKQKAPIWRVLALMKPEWPLIGLGVIGACGSGVIFPIFGLVFSTITTVLLVPSEIDPGPFQGANLYAFAFVLSGIGAFVMFSLQFYGFEMAGAKLTHRIRLMTFKALIRQEVGFFDEDGHSLGALTSRLAIDAAKVGDLVTKVWADATQLVVTAICGITIGLVYSWKLTFIIMLAAPFMVVASYYESRVRKGFEDTTKKAYEESGTIAAEAFKEIRTVAALTREKFFESKFSANLEHPHQLALEKAKYASIGNGVSQAFAQFANALGFYAGIRLIVSGDIEFQSVFKVLMAVMFTAQGLGRGSTFVETFIKAKFAAINTFELIDRPTSIDPEDDNPELDDAQNIHGNFEFKDVAFRYPSRPTVPIFGGEFELTGKANKTIALVGPSGCGKSSAIGMIQRWYDTTSGSVLIDGKDVKDYQLKKLRANMAIVSQEPTLFDMSIRENILAGTERVDISDAELDEIAKMANIYSIIKDMPDGYDTRVGDKGSQLSGGQKQRVAIARALIRNPKFLLLDEATSALDSESEKHVQQAIDNAISIGGRTTITIAHRLSTIQNSDVIAVVKDGKIVELGTHNELLGFKDGVYAALVKQQDLNVLQ
ncbi:putative ABC transporter protein [Chytriomyces sp. MP71]|nr:putative ABC transporter protein [Chytriomyces sp. MP71]